MGLSLITAAASYPITLADAKKVCRIDTGNTAFDGLIEDYLIPGAVGELERLTGRGFVSQVWRLSLDGFSATMELPRAPVTAVGSVKYHDTAGVLQTAAVSLYTVDLVSEPQWVVLNDGKTWPETMVGVNTVLIDFTVGYATLPADLKIVLLALVAHRFINGVGAEAPPALASLVNPFRTLWTPA